MSALDHRCPLCNFHDARGTVVPNRDAAQYKCPNCKTFLIDGLLLDTNSINQLRGIDRVKLSYYVNQNQLPGSPPLLDSESVEDILSATRLPTPSEQIDRLLTSIADETEVFGEVTNKWDTRTLTAMLGLKEYRAVLSLLDHLDKVGLLKYPNKANVEHVENLQLTIQGWKRVEEIRKAHEVSRRAFMAMSFNHPDVATAYEGCFKKACKRAGFDLYTVPEVASTGSITNHIAVAILESKFLVVDLTYDNLGAYWEAGFGEGLNKPVFYTCERKFFETESTHFDTNHHVTTIWDLKEVAKAEQDLVDRIRRQFPNDAKMEDS